MCESYESDEEGWHECLTPTVAKYIDEKLCSAISKKILYDIIYSYDRKKFDPDDFECIDTEIYYTQDYEKCTLKLDIGNNEIGTSFDSICIETYVGKITNDEINPIDATIDDIELINIDHFYNTKVTMYFLKLREKDEEDYDELDHDGIHEYDSLGKWEGKINDLL